MMTIPETRHTLLLKIRDPRDRKAWYEFEEIYRPMVYRIGRRHGLRHDDALDLVQEVLCKIERAIGDWVIDQPSGSFRKWLRTVARNAAIDAIRKTHPDMARGGTSVQKLLASVPANPDEWNYEWEREIFRQAARRVRYEFADSTWIAFWRTVVDGVSCEEVAKQLAKSVGAIYTARSRVIRRIRVELESIDGTESKRET